MNTLGKWWKDFRHFAVASKRIMSMKVEFKPKLVYIIANGMKIPVLSTHFILDLKTYTKKLNEYV